MQATIQSLSGEHTAFPEPLRQIPDPPDRLFVVGSLPSAQPVAIVGSRRASAYGKRMTALLAGQLAVHGVPVISGLAFGIDAAAHAAALEAGGRTIAVLASGLDRRSISPRTNLPLAERIVSSGGALIAEYEPGTMPRKEYFLARNRLISGLARAVVVVEAELPSGSLITARHAADQGREVWALPGPIDSPTSRGTNELLSQGAHPLADISHFLQSLGLHPAETSTDHPILAHLSKHPRHINALAEVSGIAITALEAELTKLELAGLVQHLMGNYYVRS